MPKNGPLSVSIIVPTKNEARSLPTILSRVARYADELIVVDARSTDETIPIAKSFGARILFDHGKGKGDALRVAGRNATKDILLFIDADGSHDPKDIPRLLAPIQAGHADHVTGSRMLGGSDELFSSLTEFVRLVGSEIITLSLGKRFGIRLTDSQNGFRCLLRSVFLELDLRENITTIEQEMVAETIRRGYRLIEVSAHEYRRQFGTSSINVWKVGFQYVFCLIRNLLKPRIRDIPSDLPELQSLYSRSWMDESSSKPQAHTHRDLES